jgi:DNA mismatch repair protein MutS2
VRAEARAAVEGIADRLEGAVEKQAAATPSPVPPAPRLAVGARVSVGGLGLEGIVTKLVGNQVELDVRGKRLRATPGNLRVVAPPAPPAKSSVTLAVDLQPRQGSLVDLNLIGCTVDEALTRAERFLDDTLITDERTIRMVHGHGTGQLCRAIATFLRTHPLVARFEAAPPDQGGGGVTVVELKD